MRARRTAVALLWTAVACGSSVVGCGDDEGGAPTDGGTGGRDGSTDGSPGGGDSASDANASDPDATMIDAGAPLQMRGTWRAVSSEGAPTARVGHTIVWTGTEHIVWGGQTTEADLVPRSEPLGDGARYDPATDRWQPVSMLGAPSPRSGHKAVWTGRYMAVFGRDVNVFPTQPMEGWLYDPATDTWRPMASAGAPVPRAYYDVVATDGRVVVWGGWSMPGMGTEAYPAASGASYDPESDAWTDFPQARAPEYGGGHTVIPEPGGFVTYGASVHFLAPGAGETVAFRYELDSDGWSEIGRTMGLIGNGQAYNTSVLVDGRLVSVSTTPDSRQCVLLELDPGGTFSRTVLSEVTTAAAPACPLVLRLEPLVAAGFLVAAELRLLLELESHEIFGMPPPPYDDIASEPLSPGYVVSSWDGYAASTDGSSVFVFGGVIRASEVLPPCPEGAPCAGPGQEARGALGALLSL